MTLNMGLLNQVYINKHTLLQRVFGLELIFPSSLHNCDHSIVIAEIQYIWPPTSHKHTNLQACSSNREAEHNTQIKGKIVIVTCYN